MVIWLYCIKTIDLHEVMALHLFCYISLVLLFLNVFVPVHLKV